MKLGIPVLMALAVAGCAGVVDEAGRGRHAGSAERGADPPLESDARCPGESDLPPELAGKLVRATDDGLLRRALGEPGEGKLCQGRVYRVAAPGGLAVFRAWNSTNPGSEMGAWWAARMPAGKVARYRAEYEICYQWSPLDKLTRCTLAPGVDVVVGTGQSAVCSAYLEYPPSAEKQIYIEDAASQVTGCAEFDGEFAWTPVE